MDTHAPSDADSPDTNIRIDATSPAADRPNGTTTSVTSMLADKTAAAEQSRFCAIEANGTGDTLDGLVAAVTTIAHSWCEQATDYADIETLVCQLPIDHLTFAAHDASAPYSGPYPMAIQVRACLLKELNDWDDTALHDHLRARPSLRRRLGFETLPAQSTFWRAWHHRFSEALRAAVCECAASVLAAAQRCDVVLPGRIGSDKRDDSATNDRPEHQLVAETTDEVWQQAQPFVCDAFALDRGSNWQIHEHAFWEQHAYIRCWLGRISNARIVLIDSLTAKISRESMH